MKKRLAIITMLILLMIAVISIINISMKSAKESAILLASDETSEDVSLYNEDKLFERSALGYEYRDMSFDHSKGRDGEEYHGRRAYPGAPPTIPHAVLTETGIGGKKCLQCHMNGGFVQQFDAYAPVTPHPEMLNCKQCHVPVKTEKQFSTGTSWKKKGNPKMHLSALNGSPPMIPHTLQMKENCLSCHAGPGARKDIRVSHPERVNCRQCHVPNKAKEKGLVQEFIRPSTTIKKGIDE